MIVVIRLVWNMYLDGIICTYNITFMPDQWKCWKTITFFQYRLVWKKYWCNFWQTYLHMLYFRVTMEIIFYNCMLWVIHFKIPQKFNFINTCGLFIWLVYHIISIAKSSIFEMAETCHCESFTYVILFWNCFYGVI